MFKRNLSASYEMADELRKALNMISEGKEMRIRLKYRVNAMYLKHRGYTVKRINGEWYIFLPKEKCGA